MKTWKIYAICLLAIALLFVAAFSFGGNLHHSLVVDGYVMR